MADSDRTPPHLVEFLDRMAKEPYAFDFFQAVRVLDCMHDDKLPTGRSTRVADDAVRFAQDVSMVFPPATLSKVEFGDEVHSTRVEQRFLGLLGSNGPLPLHLTEYVRDRLRDKGDETFRRFLDVFSNRMTALFYRAWARVRPTVSFDDARTDRFSEYVGTLFGLGMPALQGRDSLPDLPKRHFAGLLSCQTKNAEGLKSLLTGYFGFQVEIEEFVGQWIAIPVGSQCLTGASSSDLGMTTTVGSHVWDCQQKFRIIIGPLTLDQFQRMLPGGVVPGKESGRVSLDAMVSAVRTYVGDELDWDLQMILRKEETPSVQLGEQGQLGWTTWMPPKVVPRDPDDLILRPMERVFEAARRRRMVPT